MKFKLSNLDAALKAEAILAGYHVEDAVVEEAIEKAEGLRIPLTMKGVMVGWGEIRSDGTIVAETEDSPEGRELWQMLIEGSANCFSIGPNPEGPKFRTTESERESKDGNEEGEARGSGGAEGNRGGGGAPLWFAGPGCGPKGS